MKKYKLNNDERIIVKKFVKSRIPYIFSSGKYHGYMQYFEFIIIEVCNILLNGERIGKDIYETAVLPDLEYDPQINEEELDEYALNYYNEYLKIIDIIKKYHCD